MGVREFARLHLETIVPVPMPQTLQKVPGCRQIARFPLFDDVAILVQHQPGVVEEVSPAAAQVDAARACRRDRKDM